MIVRDLNKIRFDHPKISANFTEFSSKAGKACPLSVHSIPQSAPHILLRREKIRDRDLQRGREHVEFSIRYPPLPCLDLADGSPVDIPSNQLAFGRKVSLAPSTLIADNPDLLTNDIFVLRHCSDFGA